MGDPFGIGPEIVKKAIDSSRLDKRARFVLIGDKTIFARYKILPQANVSLLEVESRYNKVLKIGAVDQSAALASLNYLHQAICLIQSKKAHALVTAPVCKEGIAKILPSFCGHTDFLAEQFAVKKFGMMFVGPGIKTMIATRHVAIKDVSIALTQKVILSTIELMHGALKRFFKVSHPRIAVCGLNPHAGENGTIGREEITRIIPAINKAKRRNIQTLGPFAADTLFIPSNLEKYDGIVAMYHDQGLAPVKALYFDKLVNLTVGLPFVRTSPAHGTAFDIAGKSIADPSSMIEAMNLAARLS